MTDTKTIPLLDLEAHHAPLMDDIRAAVERVLASGRFILGPEVEALEREVAEQIGVAHAVGVSSGTDALLVSLMSLGVGSGDEVVTTPYSFFATAGCIARLGATPVFADIDPATFNLDPAAAEAAIGPRTKALLPVHLFGQPYDAVAFGEIARSHGIDVVEDAAQALGATTEVGPVGGLGTFGAFSFFPTKNLGALGDAGLVTTNDDERAEGLRTLRAHGAKPKYFHAVVGGNFRIDALQAAVLRVKLPHLPRWTQARRDNADRYDALFSEAGLTPGPVEPPKRIEPGHVFNQYVIRARHRDGLREHLAAQGIATEIYYPRPLHLQQCFAHLGRREGELPEAERASRETLALPVHPELGEADQKRIVETIAGFYEP